MLTMPVEPIQADLGISDFYMGIILGPAFGLVMATCGIPLGWAADRYPRRGVIFAGVFIWSLATAACGLANSAVGLMAARVGVGAGEAALSPAATSLLADKFPRHRLTLAIAIYQSGIKLGSAAAFALGAVLIGATSGLTLVLPLVGALQPWQIVFIIIGLPGVIFSLLVFTFSEPPRTGRKSANPTGFGDLFVFMRGHARLLTLMILGCALMALCAYSLSAWTPTFLTRRFGWEPIKYGPALGLINLVGGILLVSNGWLADKVYAKGVKDAHMRVYSWMLLLITPLAAGVYFIPDPWLFLVLYGVVQVVALPSMIFLSTTLAMLAPNEVRGQLTAVAYIVYTLLGLGIGPTMVGALTDFLFHDPAKVGWSLAIVLSACTPLAFLLLRLSLRNLRPAIAESERLAGAGAGLGDGA